MPFRLRRLQVYLGRILFPWRRYILPTVIIGLFCAFPTRPASTDAGDLAHHAAGILLVLLGSGLRAATIGLDHARRGGFGRRIRVDPLFPEGMFAHCRNPLYLGNLIIILGLLVNHNNPYATVFAGGFFLIAYRLLIAAEEQYLLERFGTRYIAYCMRVPRWGGLLSGLPVTFGEASFNWRRVLFLEYCSIALWSSVILSDLAADEAIEHGFYASLDETVAFMLGVAMIGVATIYVRHLKKSGRLSAPAT